MIIAILGGTGKEGSGLALRWAGAGHHVLLGSRDAEKAREKAAEIALLSKGLVEGRTNLEAAKQAEVVVLTVIAAGHRAVCEEIKDVVQGKVLIDSVIPLDFKAKHPYAPPKEGSAAEEAQAILGDGVKVTGAFHHISAHELSSGHDIAADGLIFGDDAAAKEVTAQLVQAAGVHPVDAGGLKHAAVIEGLTPVLMELNKRHKVKGSGIKIVGI